MKYLFVFYFSLFIFFHGFSSPARTNLVKNYIQPDGDTLMVYLTGDEFFKVRKTSDNIILVMNEEGYYCYAKVDSINGILIPGEFLAHNPEKRSVEENNYINSIKESSLSFISEKRISDKIITRSKKNIISKKISQSNSTPSKSNFIVILVEFADKSFNTNHNNELFNDMLNKENFSYQGATGSVVDYFKDQSMGKFCAEYDVVGPVKLSNNMSYYGANDYYGNDKRPQQMIYDACKLADNYVDFSKYDNDKDGVVDFVYIIYAGYGESQSDNTNEIWPHAWDIASYRLTLDNVKISSYACSNELMGYSGANLDGIGTICHETSHILGLPDFYDTTYETTNFGLGHWDVMDAGCYLNDGKTPCNYSAYERYYLGWLDPTELLNPQIITLNALHTSNEACILKSEFSENDFFIFENRQNIGWDSFLPASGMLISRICYNKNDWNNNCVNDTQGKQGVTIIPADNILLNYSYNETTGRDNYTQYWNSMKADTYPGIKNNTNFTINSSPKSEFANGYTINKPITDITEKDGIVTFNFDGYVPTLIQNTSYSENIIIETSKNLLNLSNCNNKNIEIYSLTGQLVHSFFADRDVYTFNLSSGIYFIKTQAIHKVIIK